MDDPCLLLCASNGAETYAAGLATRCGSDRGLVLTAIEFKAEKLSGGRVEEDRSYGGQTLQTFDEPIYIGSAIAQLAGHADVVIVDSLDDWALRLLRRFPDDQLPEGKVEREAEVLSVSSVIRSHMTRLIFLWRGSETPFTAAQSEWLLYVRSALDPLCRTIVDLRSGTPAAVKGRLPNAG